MNEDDLQHSEQAQSADSETSVSQGLEGAAAWRAMLDQESAGAAEGADEVTKPESAGPTVQEPLDSVAPPDEEPVTAWRWQVLRTLNYAALVVGLPAVAASSYGAYVGGRPILIPLWVGAYLLLLLPVAWPRMPYEVHAGVFSGLLYAVGFFSFFQPGYPGDGRLLFLSGAILTTILLGGRAGVVALAAGVVIHAVASWAGSQGLLAAPEPSVGVLDATDWWWSGSILVLLLGAGLVLAASRFGHLLTGAVARSRRLAEDLDDQQVQLLARERAAERSASRLSAVEELGKATAFELDPDRVLRSLVEAVEDHVACDSVRVLLVDETGERLELRSSTETGTRKPWVGTRLLDIDDTSVPGWVVRHRKPYLTGGVAPADHENSAFVHSSAGSVVAVPLVVGDNVVGVLEVRAEEAAAFDGEDVRFLTILAHWAALAFENQRQLSTASLKADPLYRASGRLSAAATQDEVVDTLIDLVAQTNAGTCLATEFVRDAEGEIDSLVCLRAWRRSGQSALKPGARLPVASSLFPVDLLEGTWVISDVAGDERLSPGAREVFESMGVGALVSFPLRDETESHGQVLALYAESGPFSERALRLYELLEDQSWPALARARRLDDALRRAQREELAARAGARMHESLDVESVLTRAAREIGQTLGLTALDVRLRAPSAGVALEDDGRASEVSRPSEHEAEGEE